MEYADIKSLNEYNKRMAQSIMDKAFFIDKIDADIIVDFGCANGDLLSFISFLLPKGKLFIGYDMDQEMLKLAEDKLAKIDRDDWRVFSDWDLMISRIEEIKTEYPDAKVALVLSSVLHEVYHYSSPVEIDKFWGQVWADNIFDNVVVRDMIPSASMERLSDVNHIANILKNKDYAPLLKDFERHHGSIQSNQNLIHFLMKYKYKEPNWQREVKENYFPLIYEDLLALIPDQYQIIYNNQYRLPHIWRNIKKDFGIDITDNTHLQMILEKK